MPISLSGASEEAHSLNVLWQGLNYLYRIVKGLEIEQVRTNPKAVNMAYMRFGNGPNDSLILNCFFWYSVSACSFLDLYSKALNRKVPLRDNFPELVKWRNKVAAHFAHVLPRSEDNLWTQSASIMQFPDWDCGRYVVGSMIVGGNEGKSPSDWCWSLTKVHEIMEKLLADLNCERVNATAPQAP